MSPMVATESRSGVNVAVLFATIDDVLDRGRIVLVRNDGFPSGASVEEQTEVLSVWPSDGRWSVATDRGTWLADHVVIAAECSAK